MLFTDEIPTGPTIASRKAGAIEFSEIPIGGHFFFAGEFTHSNTKTGPTGYRKYPSDPYPRHLRTDYLVYPDPSLYL